MSIRDSTEQYAVISYLHFGISAEGHEDGTDLDHRRGNRLLDGLLRSTTNLGETWQQIDEVRPTNN